MVRTLVLLPAWPSQQLLVQPQGPLAPESPGPEPPVLLGSVQEQKPEPQLRHRSNTL